MSAKTQMPEGTLNAHIQVFYKKTSSTGGRVTSVNDYYFSDSTPEAFASGRPQPRYTKRLPSKLRNYYQPLEQNPLGPSRSQQNQILKNFVKSVQKKTLPGVEQSATVKDQKWKEQELKNLQNDEEKQEDFTTYGDAQYEIRNGYLIYPVQCNDTLQGVSIKFDVTKDSIRIANNFFGEDIWMKKELLIPYAKGLKYRKKEPTNIQELEKNMYLFLFCKIDFLADVLKTKYKIKGCMAEARYYLDVRKEIQVYLYMLQMNNYNTQKALEDLENDLKFESEVEASQRLLVKKRQ